MKQKRTNLAREIVKRPDIIDLLKSDLPLERIFELPSPLLVNRVNLYKKLYFGVGKTDCYRVVLPNDNYLFIKMEYLNSMGNTHYSRFWIIYLYLCELLGVIVPGNTNIIEVTSGSSGIALATACNLLNYSVTIILPENLPENRVAPMRKENIEIIKVKGYIKECVDTLRDILKNKDHFFATNHSEEKAGVIIDVFKRIACEIVTRVDGIDYAILAIGNGSTTYAIGKTLKENYPNIHIQGYQPNFLTKPDDYIFGLTIPNLEFRHLKEAICYLDEIRFTTNIDIGKTKDIFRYDTEIHNFGDTSLYAVHFSLELAKKVRNKNILTIGYDKLDRY